MSLVLYGLAISLAFPIGEEGIISTFKLLLPAFIMPRRGGGKRKKSKKSIVVRVWNRDPYWYSVSPITIPCTVSL
jgi:hypothetical protein